MSRSFRPLLALVTALSAAAALASAPAVPAGGGVGVVLAKPAHGRIYHAAYPDFNDGENHVRATRIQAFERAAGRRLAWVYFSNNWWKGRIVFPRADVDRILAAHRLPFVRLMARSSWYEGHGDPNFSMQSIIDGDWDADLHDWCAAAADVPSPLLAEFGTEVNGDWFPWNGRWNGGGRRDGYGDPGKADGPERFRDAYRHLIDICRDEGADRITWFFHVDVGSNPAVAWNKNYSNYYPGERYIDWIGISDYGKLTPGESESDFAMRLDRRWKAIKAISGSKPIAVLEYGHVQTHGDRAKAGWIRRAVATVKHKRKPRISGLSYWHERWQNGNGSDSNLRITSSRRARRAYRESVAGKSFSGVARFRSR